MKKNPTAEISDKKKKLIKEKNNSPITVGERVGVKMRILNPRYADSLYKGEKGDKVETATVLEVLPKNKIKVVEGDGSVTSRGTVIIDIKDINSRDLMRVGANPFSEDDDNVRTVAFTLQSVLFSLSVVESKRKKGEGQKSIKGIDEPFNMNGIDIGDLNWNPFVYGKDGKKNYFQRDFVWTLEDKQNLIDSIYQRIDCGRILVRRRSWEELKKMADAGETELFWHDIIDGKQRLNAVGGFIRGEYPDSQGNYYNDLSFYAQHELTNHQLFGYSEMSNESSDESVIRQFLKLNFCGVLQSAQHIAFVKSIQKKI